MTDALVVDVSRDWAIACDVQQRFMQGLDRASETLDYSAQCRQVHALGGDCYDFVPLADKRLAVMIGDASGKGLAAALMISNVQSPRYSTAFSMQQRAHCGTSMQATIPRWLFGGTVRLFGSKPVGHPSECFRIGPMRKGLFSLIRVIWSSPTLTA